MEEPNALSLLPPLLAIALAIVTRRVTISLLAGIWLGYCLLLSVGPVAGLEESVKGVLRVFNDAGNTRVILFTVMVGGLLATLEGTGGVQGFIALLEKRSWVNSPKRAQFLAWGIGIVIFVESNITLLVAGAVSRPLFDRFTICREKLAYLIDSTSAPICILIPFNAWGAFNIGLLANAGAADPLGLFLAAIPLNLYAIAAVLLAGASIVIERDIGPMRRAQKRRVSSQINHHPTAKREEHVTPDIPPTQEIGARASNMILPIVTLVLCLPVALLITGDGDIRQGSGSSSVLWSVTLALAVSWACALRSGASGVAELSRLFLRGAGGFLPVAVILLLSMALGDVAAELRGGQYLASLTGEETPAAIILPLTFFIAAAIAFSVGSSWGTFAIMIPISLSLATALGLPAAPMLGAVLSGAIFGDHASPISDTTIVASMAAGTNHIDHVTTQLPYALIAGAIAALGFFAIGLLQT